MVHDLTKDDIRRYVKETLVEDARFNKFANMEARYVGLVEEIVCRAQGVFLWVYLVVRSLYRGLTHTDDISDLEARLRQMPPDLEAYFQHIFDGIDKFYHEQTSRIFQVVTAARQPLLSTTIANLELEKLKPDYALAAEMKPLGDGEIYEAYKMTQKRVNARCKDLLEVNEYPTAKVCFRYKVDFLHRTVRDFLGSEHMRRMLAGWSSP